MKTQESWSTSRRLGLDIVILSASVLAAFLIHFEARIPDHYRSLLPVAMILGVGPMVMGLLWGRAYRKVTDFVSLRDFVGVLRGTALAALAIVLANAVAPDALSLPWSLVSNYLLLSTAMMSLTIFLRRLWLESALRRVNRGSADITRRPILVYGAGRAGSLVARDIQQSPELGYELVGFIDDDPSKWGMEFHGQRVIGGRYDLPKVLGPDLREIVLAIPTLDAEVRREVLSHCRRSGAQVRIVPGIAELLNDRCVAHQIRDVRVEDLLPREAVELDEKPVKELIIGETVMVTGAAGSIGSVLCHQILRHEPGQLLMVEQSESRLFYLEKELERKLQGMSTELVPIVADICDSERMEALIKTYRPSQIFHAAAYKHVPMMEKNPQEAIRNNVLATHGLAVLANQYLVDRFTLVSTDKAVEPSSVMGASKRCAELVLRELQRSSETRYVTVRFGNVLDSDGSVVPLFKKQIAEGGPITITHPEMERFFMTIPEAARLILQATAMSEGGEVFVLEMGKPVRVLDLARSLVELSGLRFMEDIQVTFSGMRPGEKLTEKLFFDHERNVPTTNKMIHRARLGSARSVDHLQLIDSLRLMLRSSTDAELAVRFMTLVRNLDAPKPIVSDQKQRGDKQRVVPLKTVSMSG